ncbi:unnamed protein product [Brugia pahangi]|uniref:Ovule protein n=1 Tax=Brugia pahangi TaxID=6280 RepID=A0A0N4TS70_BRUPA|nr:unnamed protein product [Brugia pahangi]
MLSGYLRVKSYELEFPYYKSQQTDCSYWFVFICYNVFLLLQVIGEINLKLNAVNDELNARMSCNTEDRKLPNPSVLVTVGKVEDEMGRKRLEIWDVNIRK